MTGDVETLREAIARRLAGIKPGEDWPTNEALGGSLTGTRDDEYRAAMGEQADELIADVVGPALAEAWRQGATAQWLHLRGGEWACGPNPWATYLRTDQQDRDAAGAADGGAR